MKSFPFSRSTELVVEIVTNMLLYCEQGLVSKQEVVQGLTRILDGCNKQIGFNSETLSVVTQAFKELEATV